MSGARTMATAPSLSRSSYYYDDDDEGNYQTSWDTHYQRRGRNRERHEYVNSSSEEEFHRGNDRYSYRPQQRRSHSADSRPQYNTGRNNSANHRYRNPSPSQNAGPNRDRSSFFDPSYPNSHSPSVRAFSDAGYGNGNGNGNGYGNGNGNGSHANSDSFGFYDLPRYGGVVHDDSILYSSSDRRRYGGSDAFLSRHEQPPYDSGQRMHFSETQHLGAHDTAPHAQRQVSSREREQRYYDYAKDNLITFGGFDAQTASTGQSQEELLQRKRREHTWQKRREKRRNKSHRILNIPTNLRKSLIDHQMQSQHKHKYKQQKQQQQQQQLDSGQYPSRSPPSNQNNAVTPNSIDRNGREDTTNNRNGDNGREKGVRAAMVRRQKEKMKRLQRASCNSTTAETEDDTDRGDDGYGGMDGGKGINGGGMNSELYREKDNFDRFMEDPDLLPANAKKGVLFGAQRDNIDRDYLSLPKVADHSPHSETTPKTRRNNGRPAYADFTPKSEYTPRESLIWNHQETSSAKDSSPASVMDLQMRNGGGVRWNEKLMQEEYIFSPQSTKLRFDSDPVQHGSSSQKPKSILRSRYSSSRSQKLRLRKGSRNPAIAHCPSDEVAPAQPSGGRASSSDRGIRNRRGAFPENHPSGTDFFDDGGGPASPRRMDLFAEEPGKFSESYVHFIEAVAAVVIQTKIRQFLAKIKVQRTRNGLYGRRATGTRTAYTVRDLARRNRLEQKTKIQTRRSNAALDFYSLAAIRIQAAFRGWWVRDCLTVDNYCASLIQKEYRGMRCRNEYRRKLYHIVLVQSACRRWIAMDAAVTRFYCIVRIQAIVRGALVRKRMRNFHSMDRNNVYDLAATMIQTQWRSFVCEINFLRIYEDILVVQSVVRRWLAMRRVRSLQQRNFKSQRQIGSASRFKSSALRLKSRKDFSPGYSNGAAYTKHAANTDRRSQPVTSRSALFGKQGRPTPANERNVPEQHNQYNLSTSQQPIKRESPKSVGTRPESINSRSALFEKQWRPTPANERNVPERHNQSKISTTQQTIQQPIQRESPKSVGTRPESINSRSALFGKQWRPTPANVGNVPERHNQNNMSTMSGTQQPLEKENPKSVSSSRGQFHINSVKNDVEPTKAKSFRNETNVSVSRSNIERRRKEKEQEAKAHQEEQDRRNAAQAAEMSELQSRRKAMALKAEARQKEEAAAKQMNNSMLQTTPSVAKPIEEKSADEESHTKETDATPRNPNGSAYGTTRKKGFKSTWLNTESTTATEPAITTAVGRKDSGSFQSAGESLVANRLRELKKSRNVAAVEDKHHDSAHVNNETVDEIMNANVRGEEQNTTRPSQKLDRKPVDQASPSPTAKTSAIESRAPKRSGKNNAYHEQMRSLRSETEQKRLDEMHFIFQQAGLFLRTKGG